MGWGEERIIRHPLRPRPPCAHGERPQLRQTGHSFQYRIQTQFPGKRESGESLQVGLPWRKAFRTLTLKLAIHARLGELRAGTSWGSEWGMQVLKASLLGHPHLREKEADAREAPVEVAKPGSPPLDLPEEQGCAHPCVLDQSQPSQTRLLSNPGPPRGRAESRPWD